MIHPPADWQPHLFFKIPIKIILFCLWIFKKTPLGMIDPSVSIFLLIYLSQMWPMPSLNKLTNNNNNHFPSFIFTAHLAYLRTSIIIIIIHHLYWLYPYYIGLLLNSEKTIFISWIIHSENHEWVDSFIKIVNIDTNQRNKQWY